RRGAGTAKHPDRQRARGLRGRVDRGRHLPARQPVVPDPARGTRSRAGGRCARRAAVDPVLAGRGARSQRRVVRGGGAVARRNRREAVTKPSPPSGFIVWGRGLGEGEKLASWRGNSESRNITPPHPSPLPQQKRWGRGSTSCAVLAH